MPSTNLPTLPPEMISNITSRLRPIEIAYLRLVCRDLHAKTRPAPPLSHQAWCRFHNTFEYESSRRRANKHPIDLACTSCMTLLPPDRYQDSQAKRRCDRMSGRICFQCGVREGIHNVSWFRYQKDVCFACFACSEPKKASEEADYDSLEPGLPLRGVVYQPSKGNKRWCKQCWRVIILHCNATMSQA